MINAEQPTWDGRDGTAGGVAFGAGLAALVVLRWTRAITRPRGIGKFLSR